MDSNKKILPIVQDYIKIRYATKISQEMLSSLSGIHASAISVIELGEVIPSVQTLNKLINALGYNIIITPYSDKMTGDIITDIVNIRKSLGISRLGLSKLSGVGNTTLSRLESGKSNPGISTLCKIAEVLHLQLKIISNNTNTADAVIFTDLCAKLKNMGISIDTSTPIGSLIYNLHAIDKTIIITPLKSKQK